MAPTEFSIFNLLPTELRWTVWEAALLDDRRPGVHFFSVQQGRCGSRLPSSSKEVWEVCGPRHESNCISSPQNRETITDVIANAPAFEGLRRGNMSTYARDGNAYGALWSTCWESREIVYKHLAKFGLSYRGPREYVDRRVTKLCLSLRMLRLGDDLPKNPAMSMMSLHPGLRTGRLRNGSDGSMQDFIVEPKDLVVLQPEDFERLSFESLGTWWRQTYSQAQGASSKHKQIGPPSKCNPKMSYDRHFAFEFDPTWTVSRSGPLTVQDQSMDRVGQAMLRAEGARFWLIDYRLKRRPSPRATLRSFKNLGDRHVFSANGYRFVEVKAEDWKKALRTPAKMPWTWAYEDGGHAWRRDSAITVIRGLLACERGRVGRTPSSGDDSDGHSREGETLGVLACEIDPDDDLL